MRPKMHKNIFLYNSDYAIENKQEEKQISDNIPSQINKTESKYKIVYSKDIPQINTTTQTKEYPVKKEISGIKTNQTVNKKTDVKTVTTKPKEIKTQQQNTKQSMQTSAAPVKTENKLTQNNSVKQTAQSINNNSISTQENTIKTENISKNQILNEQEEVILWNKWRSEIQNRIMQDVKLPVIQEGIVFKFAFDVDKYGKITNVRTWSTTPMYTPYAIQYIAPVIRSYQGKDILNFPQGSTRFSTTVEGAWKISKNVKYSTPLDYNDSEKISR